MTWLIGWTYRKEHTITGSSAGAQTDYQVGIKVYYTGDGIDGTETIDGVVFGKVCCGGHCRTDFGDIRFALENGTQLLYWIESKNNSNNAIIWVKVDAIPASPSTKAIYVYYGKSDASPDVSFTNTFLNSADDSFDSQTTGTVPTGFSTPGSGSCTVTSASNYNSVNGISAVGPSRNGVMSSAKSFGSSFTNVAISFRGRASQTNSYGGPQFKSSGGTEFFNILFRENGNFGYYNGTWNNLAAYSSSTWYRVELKKFNFTSHTYSTCINGTEYSGLSMYDTNQTNIAGFQLYQRYDGTVYYDNFIVRKYVNPEPTHTSWGNETTSTPSLCVRKGTQTHSLKVVANGSGHSGMGGIPKIAKDDQVYDLYLVETTDSTASPVRIKTTQGIKAIQCAETCQTCQSCIICQSGCQVTCDTCDTCNTCNTGCEVSCETCNTTCNVGCEVSCETCDTTCNTGCQITCDTCDACNTCNVGCEISCDTCDTCNTGCEVSCQTVCETTCTECQACQSCDYCQACYTCQTCNTSCEISCQTTCELNCQTTCEAACQASCELGCQAVCQVACTECQVCETCDYCQLCYSSQ